MEFTSSKQGEYLVVTTVGRLDATTSHLFEEQCDQWLADDNTRILVDMAGIEFISSAGLRSILASAKKLKGASGDIRFCGLSGMVSDVFKVSGFGTMFKLFDTQEQALGS
ncbi:MAG: STAS domain-containing protein [Proteobacteria bacterium]|nr:STAS domain-containing protein [Pseudomonadota bacterium]MBU1610938.1 STAS domain-containing protein [Pseudomonadota bacterium]